MNVNRTFLISLISLVCLHLSNGEKERVQDGGMAGRMRGHREDHHVDAEALLGSRKDVDELASMTEGESKKKLVVIAKKMDTDKDGRVSKEELVEWIVSSIKRVDTEEADEKMRDIDTNRDAKISWEEYVADSFPHDKVEELDKDDQKLLNEDRKYFTAADIDGDGLLSREEFAAFQTPENYEHMHAVLVELTTAEKDDDHDGAISLKEFLGELHDTPTSEWNKAETERFRTQYDTDGDGLLTGHEIARWLIPAVDETADAEAQHLMKEADKDNDGFLSFEEVGNAYVTFIESEATNYGEHLDDIKHDEL